MKQPCENAAASKLFVAPNAPDSLVHGTDSIVIIKHYLLTIW